MSHTVRIQPMSVDDLSRLMGEVDRTELMAAKYEVIRSADGLSLELVKRECDPPEEFPHWDEAGITRRTDYYRREVAGGGQIIGAFAGERLLGFVAVAVRRDGTAEVLGIFTDASMRRRGIGGRLLAAAEEHAHRAGATIMYVNPNPTLIAMGFYRKHGYVLSCLIDESTLSYPPMETCILLVKRLDAGRTGQTLIAGRAVRPVLCRRGRSSAPRAAPIPGHGPPDPWQSRRTRPPRSPAVWLLR